MSEFLKDRQAIPLYLQAAPRPLEPTETGGDIASPPELTSEERVQKGRAVRDAAFHMVDTVGALGSTITEAGFETDYNYRLDLDKELKDIPEHYQPFLADVLSESRSAEHTAWIKEKTMSELKDYETIGEYTGGSIAGTMGIMMGASVFDIPTLMTLGMGVELSAAKTAQKFGRIKQAAKVAGFEASLNAALEVPLAAGHKTSDPNDVLWAAMFGGAIGAGIGGVSYRVAKGTRAARQADELAGVAEDTLDKMAKTAAYTYAGKEAKLDLRPPSDLYDMAPSVRREPGKMGKVEEPYDPTKTLEALEAKRVRLEESQAKLGAKTFPDEPVKPKAIELGSGMVEELDFIRKVNSGEMKLSKADTTNAHIQFTKAKVEFLNAFREADPKGYKQIFGLKSNPSTADFEAGFKAAQKRMSKLERSHTAALEKYKTKLDEFGAEKDRLLEEMDALNTEIEAARAAEKVAKDASRSVGAAQSDIAEPIDLANMSDEEYDALYSIPEMRQQRIPGTKWLKGKLKNLKPGEVAQGIATRFDMAGVLGNSPSQAMRVAGSQVFQDAVPKVGHAVNPESSTELAEWIRDSAMGIYDSVARPAYKAWLKEEGYASNIIARALDWDGTMRAAFEEEVTQAVKNGEHPSKNVLAAAAAMAKAYKRAFDFAVETKLPGFDKIEYDPHYLPRKVSHSKVMNLNTMYEVSKADLKADSALGEMYYRAMMEKNPWFDPETTLRVANAIAKREVQRAYHVDYDLPDFGQMTREKLDEMFDAIDVTDVDRKNFFASLDQQFAQEDAGRVNRAKNRMELNPNHKPIVATYTGPDVEGGIKHGHKVELTLEGMYETRGDLLLQGYVNELAGWGALNKVTNGKVHNPSSRKKWKEDLMKFDQTFVGDPKRFEKRAGRKTSPIQAELQYLEIGINHTLGRAINPVDTTEASIRRFLNGWNFMRVMNQTIFPQLSESSKIMTSTAIDTVYHYAPVMKDTYTALKNGVPLEDGQMKLVLAARQMGLGTNVARGGVVSRWETDLDGALYTKADKGAARIAHLKKVTARPLQAGMDVQELLAATSLQAELAMRAKGIKKMDKGDLERLAWMGISKSDIKAINAQIMKHATDEKGQPYHSSSSKWMGDLGLDKWDDPVARDKVSFGIKRRVGEIIQTNNVGNLPKFALSDIGAILTQFRTFPIAAYNKQLMHHLAYNDVNTYLTFALNSALSTLAYAGQRSLMSVGRDDAQEYRDIALSRKNLAFAAWERSAWGSLTPMAGDVISVMLRDGQVMNPYSTRNTGLGKLTAGIPAVDLIDKAGNAFSHLFTDEKSARRKYQDVYSLMPFYNFMGLQNVSQAIAAQIPE